MKTIIRFFKYYIWNYYGWQYLLAKADTPNFCNKWERFKCRVMNHPAGTIYYNPNGLQPDDRCKTCGDYI